MGSRIFDPFEVQRCTFCGLCFNKCPVIHLPLEEAIQEMYRLVNGEETKHVLQKCESCFDCNYICPEEANPAQLILQRWHEKYERDGMGAYGAYFIPHEKTNFRTYVLERLPSDEKEILKEWALESPVKEIFYPGCNIITVPYLTKSKIFDGYIFRGSLDFCCGEMYLRMGLPEKAREAGLKVRDWLHRMGVKKVTIACTAGYNMFTNVLPSLGVEFDVEFQHFYPILLEKLKSGELKVTNPLNISVTIQDSCYGKIFGDRFLNTVREILKTIGVTITEAPNTKYTGFCCGIAGGFSQYSNFNPVKIAVSTIRSIKNLTSRPADSIAVYCAGCLQMLSVGKLVYPTTREVFHIFELVQMAIGEKPLRRQKSRAVHFFAGTLKNQAPLLLSKKRYRIGKIFEGKQP